ncbi:MAG: NPCBM/NEW2 domain-containing protein [Pirellulales bacterium]|nr:NPCBM/NEW2 domain-containing protein [Pirellulales bacterium]
MKFAISLLTLLTFLALHTFPLSAAPPKLPQAVPIDGPPFTGELTGLDAAKNLVFQTQGQTKLLPLNDLVTWGTCPEPRRGPVLVLTDGGLLPAEVLAADKDALQAESDRFGPLAIPLEMLAGVMFQLPNSAAGRDALLERILHASGDADRLVLENGDALSGAWEALHRNAVQWKSEVGVTDVELARISAVSFNPALRRKPAPHPLAWAGWDDGSRLLVDQIRIENGAVQVTVFGQTWKTALTRLVFLQALSGRAVYLSDCKPGTYRFTPYLSIRWPYQNDRNVDGGLLRNDGRLYLKGLGVHSAAQLSYPLEGKYQKFQAELAVDDSTDGGGSVRFHVLVDGHEKFASEIVHGRQPPTPVSVDVSGAKQLELIVDYADRGDVQDRADWLGARVIRK